VILIAQSWWRLFERHGFSAALCVTLRSLR
jgi:hypothetical protein